MAAGQADRASHVLDQLARDGLGDVSRLARAGSLQCDRELIAAEACREPSILDRVRDAVRDGLEQGVTGLVAESVVHHLEAVQVHEQECDPYFPRAQRGLDALHQ